MTTTMERHIEAAINIGRALVSMGVAEDFALHQGFQIVGEWVDTPLTEGTPLHDAYIAEADSLAETMA